MFITEATAQPAPGGPAGGASSGILQQLNFFAPLVLVFIIMYFLVIRPQQRRAKQHTAMISALKRNDTVVTSGGLIGKVTKVVDDNELEVKFGDNQPVRVVRATITEVRAKPEPAAND